MNTTTDDFDAPPVGHTAPAVRSSESPLQIGIAVVGHNAQYLVGVRPRGVPLAGFAEFPGGKVQSGETAAAAAVRECREETGLLVRADRELCAAMHRYEHGLLELRFFLCSLVPGANAVPIAPFRWATIDELARLKFPSANEAVTKLLMREEPP